MIIAHRKYALEMLRRAESKFLGGIELRVLRPEDIIGLKIQAAVNDPVRKDQEIADIRALVEHNRDSIDMDLLQIYFDLFEWQDFFERLFP